MNTVLALLTPLLLPAGIATPPQAQTSQAGSVTLERTYQAGESTTYAFQLGDTNTAMSIGAKITLKTLSLLADGKASVAVSATNFTGGPPGMKAPEPVTWTFGKDGLAEGEFTVQSASLLYSLVSAMSYVPGKTEPGKQFKFTWTATDKKSTMTGTGSYVGTKQVDGKTIAMVNTEIDVAPDGQGHGTVHSKGTFDPASGKLLGAQGTIDIGTDTLSFSVKSG